MHHGPAAATSLRGAVPASSPRRRPTVRLWFFPPAVSLAAAAEAFARAAGHPVGAQNVHWEPKGAFTGEISIPMVQEAGRAWSCWSVTPSGVTCSARPTSRWRARRWPCSRPASQPLVCVGETLAEREGGRTEHVDPAPARAAARQGAAGGLGPRRARLRAGVGHRHRQERDARRRRAGARAHPLRGGAPGRAGPTSRSCTAAASTPATSLALLAGPSSTGCWWAARASMPTGGPSWWDWAARPSFPAAFPSQESADRSRGTASGRGRRPLPHPEGAGWRRHEPRLPRRGDPPRPPGRHQGAAAGDGRRASTWSGSSARSSSPPGCSIPHIVPLLTAGAVRRPALLRHAVHRGRVAPGQAGPRRRAAGRPRPCGSCARWSTRWPTPTGTASSTATSSPTTSCSRRATRSSPTSAWPRR